MNNLFPTNPANGTIFELQTGLYFKYDAMFHSWVQIANSITSMSLATNTSNGLMSAVDLKKLNRLVISPPMSSIIGTDCAFPFRSGNISLYSGDQFIKVDGNPKLTNLDQFGDRLAQNFPFKIHQNTYGFNFSLDMQALVQELQARGRYNVTGKRGDKGIKGDTGEAGVDFVLSGPPGDPGIDGAVPPCNLAIEDDDLAIVPVDGTNKALVGLRAVTDSVDKTKYRLVFDRQTIGPVGFPAEQFIVKDEQSPWVLAITSASQSVETQVECGDSITTTVPQTLYYVDVEPIIDSVHTRYLAIVDILRNGYEEIVKFWIQTMSDLFDEQKVALCCALEHCMSISKNQGLRQHMESVAASAAGSANIAIHARDSDESVTLSSTRTLKTIGGPDLCRNGPRFPQGPQAQSQDVPTDLAAAHLAVEDAVSEAIIIVDPAQNASMAGAIQGLFNPGRYTAVIQETDAKIDGHYRADVKVAYISDGLRKVVQFLNKGEFTNVIDAQSAYEGLSLTFTHDGGPLLLWLSSLQTQIASGLIKVMITQAETISQTIKTASPDACFISHDQLNNGANAGVISIMGQRYCLIECQPNGDCLQALADHNAIIHLAWPTFDGVNPASLPIDGAFFKLSPIFNELAKRQSDRVDIVLLPTTRQVDDGN